MQDKTKGLQAKTSDAFRSSPSATDAATGKGLKRSRSDSAEGGEPASSTDAAPASSPDTTTTDTSDGASSATTAADAGPTDPILLFERSVMSDRHVFVANCSATGLFQDCETRVFSDWHSWLLKSFAVRVPFDQCTNVD